jgi:hypothetical protein
MYDVPDETHSGLPHDLPVMIGNVPLCSLMSVSRNEE